MSRHVRQTLAALGAGAVLQRGALLGVTVALGHHLGPEGLGRHALAVALGSTLAVLIGTGVRSVASRGAAREPERAGGWLRAAVRLRALATALVLLPVCTLVAAGADDPVPWCLGALLALPLAWDQKGLLDAAARTRREVALDSAATTLHFAGTLLLLAAGVDDLGALLAVQFAGRALYAAFAERTLRHLPGFASPPAARAILRQATLPTLTQTWTGLVQTGDVWLVRWLAGEAAAGLYAVAARIAATAALPGAQLARLLQPHNDRAAAAGCPGSTVARGLRGTGFAVLPFVAGGVVAAEPLCALFGDGFVAAAPALGLLLPATALLQFGWQHSQVLFAHGRMLAWAGSLWFGSALHLVALLLCTPHLGAAGAGLAALLGNLAYLACAHIAARRTLHVALLPALAPGALVGAGTAAAACATAPLGLVAQLVAGGLATAVGLYALELRHTWHRLGAGLAAGSGAEAVESLTPPR